MSNVPVGNNQYHHSTTLLLFNGLIMSVGEVPLEQELGGSMVLIAFKRDLAHVAYPPPSKSKEIEGWYRLLSRGTPLS